MTDALLVARRLKKTIKGGCLLANAVQASCYILAAQNRTIEIIPARKHERT